MNLLGLLYFRPIFPAACSVSGRNPPPLPTPSPTSEKMKSCCKLPPKKLRHFFFFTCLKKTCFSKSGKNSARAEKILLLRFYGDILNGLRTKSGVNPIWKNFICKIVKFCDGAPIKFRFYYTKSLNSNLKWRIVKQLVTIVVFIKKYRIVFCKKLTKVI